MPCRISFRNLPWAIAVLNQPADVKCRFDQFLGHSEPIYVFVKGIQSPKLDIFWSFLVNKFVEIVSFCSLFQTYNYVSFSNFEVAPWVHAFEACLRRFTTV